MSSILAVILLFGALGLASLALFVAGARVRTCLVVASVLLASGCGYGPSEAESDQTSPTPVTTASDLHAALADQVAFEFDLSVFTLDEGEVTVVGPSDRLYSFDSITKTVTGLLLARLVESRELELSTPVGSLLDAGANGDITLVQLGTHTAGLPRLAPNADEWPDFDPLNPYAGYTAEMAEAALRDIEPTEEPEYTNYGFQLLGLALERSTGRALGELADEFVFTPAGMKSAQIPQQPGFLADGLQGGRTVPAWDEQLGGAGGAIGSIEDLAAYALLMLDPPDELEPSVAAAIEPRASDGAGQTGLGWVTTHGFTWHNGGSYGYSSLIVLDLANGRSAGFLAATGDLEGDAERLVFELLESKRGS